MDFIEGKTLKHCIENNIFGQKEKQLVLDGLIKNLLFLSQNGIIHGDLKPDNIIIRSDLSVEIIDFESAIRTTDKKSKIGPGSFIYRAPELLKMETDFDCSADLYSLGLIVFFMESGIDPIEFNKSLNPADALEDYFGLAHSPQIRWLVSALSNPDKNSRTTLQQIISYSHFTDCNVYYFPTPIKADHRIVDLLYSDYRNGCQYVNPILINDFYKLVAVDGNIFQHQKNMCLELCLNGVSPIDDSLSEYVLDLYSYQNNITLEYMKYIDSHIAYDSNEITKKIVISAPYTIYNQTFDTRFPDYFRNNQNYDRDTFLHASLLYSNFSHRIKLLNIHLSLCDSPAIIDFLKIDRTIDPYDAACALYGGEFIFNTNLFIKYHYSTKILSLNDRASRFADNLHLLNIFPELGDQFIMGPSTLLYEATDPYQVLQIIGSHIPPEWWNFADLCILIQVIYSSDVLFFDRNDLLKDPQTIFRSPLLETWNKIDNDPQTYQKAVKLFKQLLLVQPSYNNLLYSACMIIRKFYTKYSYLHHGWISFLFKRFDNNSETKYHLFMDKYRDIVNKMLKSNDNPKIREDSWKELMIEAFIGHEDSLPSKLTRIQEQKGKSS